MAVIKDVAKIAGVSTGTVSKYLNNPDTLKEDTKRRVEKAVKTLKYQPSPLARSMRTGITNTLAVIVPDITNPFFAEMYNSIRLSALDSGYTSILYTTEDNPDILKHYLTEPITRHVDGLVLCFLEEDGKIENLIDKIDEKTPVVLLGWDINNTRFNSVVIDVFEGMYKSTTHLIELGHKNIAYIGGPEKDRISKEKFKGYVRAIKTAGYELRHNLILHDNYSLQSGYHAARALTMLPVVPDAIAAENDILAIGCIKYFLQQKIRIPEDIAVTGFDNIPLAAMYEPSLTTVSIPVEQMGYEAIKLFISLLKTRLSKKRQIIQKTNLIVRNSTFGSAPIEFT